MPAATPRRRSLGTPFWHSDARTSARKSGSFVAFSFDLWLRVCSAPKYTGRDVANPIGAIIIATMMLEYLGHGAEAEVIERAVVAAIDAGETTYGLGGNLGTRAAGAAGRLEL